VVLNRAGFEMSLKAGELSSPKFPSACIRKTS
jgi:hypothetical protein